MFQYTHNTLLYQDNTHLFNNQVCINIPKTYKFNNMDILSIKTANGTVLSVGDQLYYETKSSTIKAIRVHNSIYVNNTYELTAIMDNGETLDEHMLNTIIQLK